ncbi:MAG: Trk system potassium transporter TrkA, partial [Balneolaceae bacterium]
MKIVIIGAGEIGYDLASTLSKEKHDVIVLDREKTPLSRVADSLDVLTIEGNATSVKDLDKAGVSNADILISVTSVDEVNMISSMIGKRLGAKMVIARVRSDEFSDKNSPLSPSDLGIDVMIHPELSAAQEIVQLLRRSSASDVVNLADDKMQLVGIRLEKESPLVGISLKEYAATYPETMFRVVAIVRRGRTLIPNGSVKLQSFDQIFVLSKTEDIPHIIETTGKKEADLNRVMIAGGSALGAMITKLLTKDKSKDWSVKLIEPDYDTAEELAVKYKNAMILHGNPTDPDLLITEGITDMDAFIAVTDDEESNIISCLMAKHLEVKKTVALVSKPDFIPLAQTIGLDAIINKKAAA